MTQSKPASKATSYESIIERKAAPADPAADEDAFHSAYICAPPELSSLKLPLGYVTRSTGAEVFVLVLEPVPVLAVGTGLFGKGSATKARSAPPFWILPLLRPQLATRKDWVSVLARVAVGKGMEVEVAREYWDAAEVAGTTWAYACQAGRRQRRKQLASSEIMVVGIGGVGERGSCVGWRERRPSQKGRGWAYAAVLARTPGKRCQRLRNRLAVNLARRSQPGSLPGAHT